MIVSWSKRTPFIQAMTSKITFLDNIQHHKWGTDVMMGWNFSSADSKICVTCVRILSFLAASRTYEAVWTGTRFLSVYVHVPVSTQCDRAVEKSLHIFGCLSVDRHVMYTRLLPTTVVCHFFFPFSLLTFAHWLWDYNSDRFCSALFHVKPRGM